VIPAAQTEVLEKLRLHGISLETLATHRTLRVDTVRLHDVKLALAHDGRIPVTAQFTHEQGEAVIPASTVRVASDQPLGLLAAALLEPESLDSFLAWRLFPETLSAPAGTEDFVIAPILDALLASDAELPRSSSENWLRTSFLPATPRHASDGWLIGCLTGIFSAAFIP
jgi:hypothetical protein